MMCVSVAAAASQRSTLTFTISSVHSYLHHFPDPTARAELSKRKMDTSPTALFDSYEQDFKQIADSIKNKLDGDASGGAFAWSSDFCNLLTDSIPLSSPYSGYMTQSKEKRTCVG